ncbi:hypothetical protein HYPSUDRAFT_38344 [Hypholoma sublateritium FD-334 SS-4]|uniref:Uncharacterized protein n=1 Tax=Hypholoma sublateritium (strain FD-334 SS-4) TaxID=945553 RepID=A0A0D2P8I6_HYPSF|nr:hypothetical protein HYPSUDRAFT_38344 [Hypholoma sublateritium FD-334 SS-4]
MNLCSTLECVKNFEASERTGRLPYAGNLHVDVGLSLDSSRWTKASAEVRYVCACLPTFALHLSWNVTAHFVYPRSLRITADRDDRE